MVLVGESKDGTKQYSTVTVKPSQEAELDSLLEYAQYIPEEYRESFIQDVEHIRLNHIRGVA